MHNSCTASCELWWILLMPCESKSCPQSRVVRPHSTPREGVQDMAIEQFAAQELN